MKKLISIYFLFLSLHAAAQVTSVSGTANQVITSGSSGVVVLSLPQDIATSSTPEFKRLAIGNASSSTAGIYNRFPITGSTIVYSNLTNSTVQSDVTEAVYGYRSQFYTQAADFNLNFLRHFFASQGTIGAGSTVGNQYGFQVSSSLIGATNNFGFYSAIPSGAGRWNLYMAGTGANYMAGNLGIGTTNPTEKLSVNGNIRAKEVKVESANWPDYVFHKTYSLQPLSEVEKFIATNQHLPGIPSALAVEKEGLNLGEMNAILLKKIEELTLYIIEQNKRIEKLEHKQ